MFEIYRKNVELIVEDSGLSWNLELVFLNLNHCNFTSSHE